MIKYGSTKLALDRVPQLAKALWCDPAFLLRLTMEQSLGLTSARAVDEIRCTPMIPLPVVDPRMDRDRGAERSAGERVTSVFSRLVQQGLCFRHSARAKPGSAAQRAREGERPECSSSHSARHRPAWR